jgi:hypothetical protein
MRAIIIGSSMAMPRLECNYDDTWIAKLVKKYPQIEFIDKCRRSSSAIRLVDDGAGAGDTRRGADLLEYYNPNFVITQIGITDCSPRLLKRNKKSTKIINELPDFLSKLIYDFVRKNKGRAIKNADLSVSEFRQCWINYIQRAKDLNTFVICVKISIPTSLFLSKSPLSASAIDLYNNVFEKLALEYSNLICFDPYNQSDIDRVAIDEFHVNEEGQTIVFNKLIRIIDEYIVENKRK